VIVERDFVHAALPASSLNVAIFLTRLAPRKRASPERQFRMVQSLSVTVAIVARVYDTAPTPL